MHLYFCSLGINYINVPLNLKVQEVIFFAGKTHNEHFEGFSEWAKTFLTLNCTEHSGGKFWGQKG